MIDNLKIDIEKFNKVVKAIKKSNMKEVSFEFLVGSCFPKALENIKEEMSAISMLVPDYEIQTLKVPGLEDSERNLVVIRR